MEAVLLIGFFSGILCMIMGVISLFRKPRKAKLWAAGLLVGFVVMLVGAANMPDQDNETNALQVNETLSATNDVTDASVDEQENQTIQNEIDDGSSNKNLIIGSWFAAEGEDEDISKGGFWFLKDGNAIFLMNNAENYCRLKYAIDDDKIIFSTLKNEALAQMKYVLLSNNSLAISFDENTQPAIYSKVTDKSFEKYIKDKEEIEWIKK